MLYILNYIMYNIHKTNNTPKIYYHRKKLFWWAILPIFCYKNMKHAEKARLVGISAHQRMCVF